MGRFYIVKNIIIFQKDDNKNNPPTHIYKPVCPGILNWAYSEADS